MIEYISQLDTQEKRKLLTEALTQKTDLFNFFAVSRGWSETCKGSGSFKRLNAMLSQLGPVQKKRRKSQAIRLSLRV